MLAIGVVIGILTGIFLPMAFSQLNSSLYKRSNLEKIMDDYLGAYNVEDVLTDEILIVAYDYNSQEPRFYSKYYSDQDKAIYDVPIGNATGASSAAPLYFEPKL